MDRYNIFCSDMQIEKAIELGAPIERWAVVDGVVYFIKNFYIKEGKVYKRPTAEQIIGWLKEQLSITTWHINHFPVPDKYGYTIISSTFVLELGNDSSTNELYDSDNEATLAAIDAVLGHWIKNKKE